MWVLTASLICPPLIQLYFYAFDIFRESGVPEDQMHYMAIGIGATELIAVTLCVSISSKHHESCETTQQVCLSITVVS